MRIIRMAGVVKRQVICMQWINDAHIFAGRSRTTLVRTQFPRSLRRLLSVRLLHAGNVLGNRAVSINHGHSPVKPHEKGYT